MKQNREHGSRRVATKIVSFILALVLVFSIFSGIASAECKIIDEKVDIKFHPTAAPEVEKQCKLISSTCEESKWERTTITTTKGNLEIIWERTYACKCENTGKWETEPTPRRETEWENDIVMYAYPFKTDYPTGGATCPKPCVTQEQFDAAASDLISWGYKVVALETAVNVATVALAAAAASLNPYLVALATAALLKAKQSLDNAKSSRDAAQKRFDELMKLPPCVPWPQRPGGCD